MTRRQAITLCAVPIMGASVPVSGRSGVHITGPLTATFQEAQEGYFSIGKEIAIVVKPESVPHQQMQAMVDTQVQLSVFDIK